MHIWWLDANQLVQVKRRIAETPSDASSSTPWRGHVWAGSETIVQDSKHRPQDLRALPPATTPAPSRTFCQDDVSSDDDEALMDLVLNTEHLIATQGSPLPPDSNTGWFPGSSQPLRGGTWSLNYDPLLCTLIHRKFASCPETTCQLRNKVAFCPGDGGVHPGRLSH